ncbi:hypothetical protein HPB47_007592 [Ixodes persulcatus]|uniref:Uncharacterized protein n=1 Tax=Ixodes persulcatus TaxID=34615 RepID=A0AC60P713_IXOPE|nr:hypothetical protein HPB47_007592 [Ixodes persulcatus]
MDTDSAERQMPVLTPEQDRVRNRDVDGPGESSPSSGLVANSPAQGDRNGGILSDSLIEKEIELVREKERLIRLELELEHLRSGNRTRTSGGGMEFNLRDQGLSYSRLMKGVLTPMPSSDTLVPSWFDTVENVFERYMVPERLRGYLVRPYFTESMRALVNRLNVGERSGYGAVKERVLLELGLSRAEVWWPVIETATSLKEKHKNPRVDAENVTVEENSSCEPDKVTTDVGKTDGNNLDHQGQKRPDPSVRETPQILLQADNTKRSSKNNRSCVSVQADVDDRNELNVSRAWRTSQRADDDHYEQVNVDDERPYTLPGRQAFRRSEDDPCLNFDNVEAGPDILPGLRKFRQVNEDHVENMGVGYKEEPRTFWQADDDHGKDVGVDKQSVILVGRLTSQRAGEDVRESRDSGEDAVFEMKSSKNITRDAGEDSTTCQPATCERDESAEDVDNGDRLRGPFLIRETNVSMMSGMLTREQEAAIAAAAQMNLLTKVTEMCDSVMQRLAHAPGQQETPPREPRPHLTVPVYMGARCWLGSQAPFTSLADFQTRLREEFLPAGYANQILRELEARTQHPDESLVRYVRVMQELFKRADPRSPESDRVARVRRQCHPRYHVYLINRTFETLEELARGARLIEEALHAERNYVPPSPAKYALEPACAWRGPEASTQVDCPNETSLPHHVNQESWRGMHGDLPCGISVCLPNSPREVPGGHSEAREGFGRGSPRQVGGRVPCPIVSWGPTEITTQANHLHQSAPASAGESWHGAVANPQPSSIDPRCNGTSPPHNSQSQAWWRPSHSGSLSDHWRRSDGHLGAGGLSRQLSSDCCYHCEQPGHHRNLCPRLLDTTNKRWHETAAKGRNQNNQGNYYGRRR